MSLEQVSDVIDGKINVFFIMNLNLFIHLWMVMEGQGGYGIH